jgi:hypothetical protein
MNALADQIYRDCQALPDDAVREIADFVELLKQRKGLVSSSPTILTGAEAFKKFSEAGLIGCMEVEVNLSEEYKSHLLK